MHLLRYMELTQAHGFPKLLPYTGNTDFEIHTYSRRSGLTGKDQALHYFGYECDFDNAVWRNLEQTTYRLRHMDYLFTPDYSMYVDDKLTHQNIEFTYRTRFVGAYWQHCGFGVIPTVSWGNSNSFGYAFEGLPEHSVLAVCGTGHNRSHAHRELWEYGMRRMEEELSPVEIFVYGDVVEVPGLHTPLRFIPDHITKHFRNDKQEK